MAMRTVIFIAMMGFPLVVYPANYNGVDIDGNPYSCQAYSYDTASWYDVDAVFDGDEVTLYFENGGTQSLELDDEDIDDPSDISAYDYDNAVYWDLDCSDDVNN
ncbi:MAG TPA: hypothetical protein VJS89_07750 [Gammaproteobacteria bacterium]|nr:hypothetical protein [Gammaproteobacteria bacterium]